MDPLSFAKKLIRIPSLSGHEAIVAEMLSDFLSKEGFSVHKILSEKGRPNIFAFLEKPEIVFCSHLDTVPPYMAFREDSNFLYGRGACDAKGGISAQLAAGLRLKAKGIKKIGFLYLVGEEVDHRGASDVSKKLSKRFSGMEAIVVGEPTENKLAIATKGIVKITLRSRGKAAHSAYPSLGYSAIHPLIETLSRIQQMTLDRDKVLGASTLNVGMIQGGVAANIFAPHAEAQILVRTVTKSQAVYEKIKRLCAPAVEMTLESTNDPIRLNTVKGFKTSVVSFNTDLPYLKKLSKKIFLFGPGSILNAHRPEEKILKKEILSAVEWYEKLVYSILK